MSEIKLIKPDVFISPIEDPVCEHSGDNCTFTVTHRICLDLAAVGIKEFVGGEYCETCATEIANSIKESLPEEEPEPMETRKVEG